MLVLDGLDEHALSQNEDELRIIRGQKLLDCQVIVSSRPHSTQGIQHFFPTIVRIDGFTLNKAKDFASKLLTDHKKITDVLNFNPADFRNDIPTYKCPILLSFLCLLVREDDIDLLSKTIHTGEINTRMVRCLYKKFTIRRNIEYEHTVFVRIIIKVGKLAWDTLLSGNNLLQRSQVIRDVGPDAFDYGLLIGHEDFRLIRDETADIFVTFPHRSIQELLGAFYFILMMNQGESIESLLGYDCKEPIFMMNPLFLYFCLWFLYSDQKYFTFDNSIIVSEILTRYCRDRCGLLDTIIQDTVFLDIVKSYPAINIEGAVRKNDTFNLKFFKILLQTIKVVILTTVKTLEWILQQELINKFAPKLSVSQMLTQFPKVNLQLQTVRTIDLSDLYRYQMITSLGPVSENMITANLKRTQVSLNLTHLSFANQNMNQSALEALRTAVSKNLIHLGFSNCKYLDGKLPSLFKTTWPKLSHLNLLCTKLDSADSGALFEEKRGMLPNLKSLMLSDYGIHTPSRTSFLFDEPCLNLVSLFLVCPGEDSLRIVYAINEGLMPNLTNLGVSRGEQNLVHEKKSPDVDLCKMSLESLTLRYFVSKPSCQVLKTIGKLFLVRLQKLDISHFRIKEQRPFMDRIKGLRPTLQGLKGNLYVLLRHSFLSLNSLILSDCWLNIQDLCTLAQASVEDRLPKLTHLDISHNNSICFVNMFQGSCKWNKLSKLNITSIVGMNLLTNWMKQCPQVTLTYCRRFPSLMIRF